MDAGICGGFGQEAGKTWKKLYDLPTASAPAPAVAASKRACQTSAQSQKIAPVYKKGMGSLGRPRFAAWPFRAVATWRGRQRRSCHRRGNGPMPGADVVAISRALNWAIPVARPMARCSEWVRLPATSRRFAQDNLHNNNDHLDLHINLFSAMGFDLGAIHAADQQAGAITSHLARQAGDGCLRPPDRIGRRRKRLQDLERMIG